MTERIVGIDFGTSTSVIRVKRYENGIPVGDTNLVLPVTFNMGSTVVPTLIKETASGKSYGYDAQIHKRNSTTYQNFKVNLESNDPEKREEARRLTRDFFTYLAKVYNEQSAGGYLGDNTDKVRTLISYPVKWSDETKKFMIETAKEAGFSNVEGMDEAQAAISAVLVQNVEHFEKYGYLDGVGSVNIMLIDMGAGTTDLVLCKYYVKEKKTEIICTWPKEGNILFGGKEVDEILRGYIESKLPEQESEGILRRCGLEKFKEWKENLISPALKKNESVDEFSELDMLIDMIGTEAEDYTVNRAVFEEQAKNYLGKFTTLINGCIEESKTDAGDIDLVILTGGHSQWYFVEEILSGKMKTFGEISLKKVLQDNNRIIPIIRPQETVAMGLVYSELKQELVVATSSSADPVIENPGAPKVEKKEMVVVDAFAHERANRIVTSSIVPENTVIYVGDTVDFYRDGNKYYSSVIKGISIGRDKVSSAKGSDDVELLFEDVTVKINKNDVIMLADNKHNEKTADSGSEMAVTQNEPDEKTQSQANLNEYKIPRGKSIAGVIRELKTYFESKNMVTQFFKVDETAVLQARTPNSLLKKFVSMDKAVEVRIKRIDGNRVQTSVGGGKWADKIVRTLVTTQMLPPLAIFGIGNAAHQIVLISKAESIIADYFKE